VRSISGQNKRIKANPESQDFDFAWDSGIQPHWMMEEMIIKDQMFQLFVSIEGDGAYSFEITTSLGRDI
jgi:hypothetical protein